MQLRVLFPLLLLLLLQSGCSAISKVLTPPTVADQFVQVASDTVHHATEELAVLSWVGGVATLFGIAAIVMTRGAIGLRAILIGVCLVILNFAIANYLSWILVPVLIGTGCISLSWSYLTVKQMLINFWEQFGLCC